MGTATIVILVILWILIIALRSAFKNTTGVDLPSTQAGRRIRRAALQTGISEAEALDNWIDNKKRQAAAKANPLPRPKTSKLVISLRSIESTAGSTSRHAVFDFHCKECGGCVLHIDDDDVRRPVKCKACGLYFGRYSQLQARCKTIVETENALSGSAATVDYDAIVNPPCPDDTPRS